MRAVIRWLPEVRLFSPQQKKQPRTRRGLHRLKILRSDLVAVSSSTSSATATTAAAESTAVAATAASTTAAESTASATAASTTTIPAATSAPTAFFAGARFVDGQGTATVFLSVKGVNRRLCFGVVGHFHKAKSLAAAGIPVVNDLSRNHLPMLSK